MTGAARDGAGPSDAPGAARELLLAAGVGLLAGAFAGAIDYAMTHAASATFDAGARQVAFAAALYGAGIATAVLGVWLLDRLLGRARDAAWPRRLVRADVVALLAPAVLGLLLWVHTAWLEEIGFVRPQSLAVTAGILALGAVAILWLPGRLVAGKARGGRRLRAAHRGAAVAGGVAFACALALAAGPGSGRAGGAPPATGRSVLLISIDSLRKDVWDAYLAAHASPALRRFAERARRYQVAYTTFSHSLPAHASMWTGLYPLEHGARVWRRGASGDEGSPVAEEAVLLAEAFASTGFETVAVLENGWLGPPYGLERGFETFANAGAPLRLGTFVPALALADFQLAAALRYALARAGRLPHPQTSWMRRWLLRRRDDRPFLAFLHYMEMHVPNAPPPRYRERFATGPFADLDGYDLEAAIAGGRIGPGELDTARAQLHALSLADLARVDDLLAPVLTALEESGRLDDTLVVLTSDHGDNFYERVPEYAHSHVYEGAMRVPLLVRVPGDREGRSIATPVSLVDLAPTLRAFAGLPPARRTSGVDLLARSGAPAERPLHLHGWDRQASGWVYGVRRGPWKLVVQADGSRELYRPGEDPAEARDLAAARPEVAQALHASVEALLAAAPDEPFAPIAPGDLPGELFEQLRRLGYVE